MHGPIRIAGILCIGIVAALPSVAQPLPTPGGDAWRAVRIPTVDEMTVYRVVPSEAGRAWRAESDCGASAMAVSLEGVDLQKTPLLSWEWRIERGLDVDAERTRSGDDFAARVIVMFEYDSQQASFLERARHALAETVQGRELPGRSLAYVWSSRQPVGSAWRNPYRAPTILISRGRGQSSGWQSESVDLAADYRRHWQAEPPPLVGLAVLTDADNTCTEAVAEYRGFRLRERP